MKRLLSLPIVLLLMSPAYAEDAGAAPAPVTTDIATAPAIDAGIAPAAPAAPVVPGHSEAKPPDVSADPFGSIEMLVNAFKAGNWKMAGAIVLALLMFVLAKSRSKVKWFKGDRGGAILVMALGLAGGFSAALAADGVSIDWRVALGIVGTVWMAVGGVSWCKRIIWPKDDLVEVVEDTE